MQGDGRTQVIRHRRRELLFVPLELAAGAGAEVRLQRRVGVCSRAGRRAGRAVGRVRLRRDGRGRRRAAGAHAQVGGTARPLVA